MERRNVDRRQAGAEQHADAYRTKFNIDKSKVAGQTGANTAIADIRGQKANKMDKVVSGVLGGIELGKDKKKIDLGFEQGGVVPGSAYAGDRVDAQLNSGEMVLNANQQQNLLDLLAGRTNSINPEVPIVEDTMVDNPLDVLATMNQKPSMADGGMAIPDSIRRPNTIEELMQKILNQRPDPNLINTQTPPDTMINDNTNPPPSRTPVPSPIGTPAASSMPPPAPTPTPTPVPGSAEATPIPPLETVNVPDSPQMIEAAPSNALPMEQPQVKVPAPVDPISQLANMKPQSAPKDLSLIHI